MFVRVCEQPYSEVSLKQKHQEITHMLHRITRLMTITLSTALLASSQAFAADAITQQETTPAPSSFEESRFYVSAFAGATFIDDVVLRGLVGGNPQTVELDFDTGYVIGGSLGHNYGEIFDGVGLRAEIELSYSDNNIDEIFFSGNGPAAEINVDGDFSSTNLFVNALFDLPGLGNDLITPYVGGGLGVAFTNLDAIYGPGVLLDSNEENFAAQAIIGASVSATENVDLFVEGRYSRIFNLETPRLAPTGALTGVIEDNVDTYGVNFGLRFKL